MTHLYLIRHAQADGLKNGIVGSIVPNSGRSPEGIIQAERLRDRLASSKEIKADIFISSTLNRAKETAEIIAPALNNPLILDDAVQELNIGDCEGLTSAEIEERFGIVTLDMEPFRRLGSTGESWAEFTFRAIFALQRITGEYGGKSIVIVTHGGFIESTFITFLGLTTLKQLPIVLSIENTSITHWHRDHFSGYGRDDPQWCLKAYNDHTHLNSIAQQR